MLSAQELQELADDINVRGQLTPILTYQAAILDGRNRWVACRMAGVDPETIEYKEADPVSFIKSLNILRRHLTTVERARLLRRDIVDRVDCFNLRNRRCRAPPPQSWARYVLRCAAPSGSQGFREGPAGIPPSLAKAPQPWRRGPATPARRRAECPARARCLSRASSTLLSRREKALRPCKARLFLRPQVAPTRRA